MRNDERTPTTPPGIDRRRFLKFTGAGFVAAATGGPLLSAFSQNPPQGGASSTGAWMASTCQGCTSWCPVQVKVVDGRAVSVRGNPHSKANHGKICPRPHMALQQAYDPDRLKVPMKRTNPNKGRDEDPGFVPIGWDEAIGTIADKMIELRDTGDTHQFAVFRGRYSYLRDVIYSALPKVFGSPNGISHSAICAEGEKFGAYYTEGFWDYRDYDLTETRYVLCWGADPVSTNRQVPHAINVWGDVRDRAAIAVVDPRLSATAAKADEWLPVIPGEDGALAVAMAHVILTEGLWSRSFVGDFTDGTNRFRSGRTVDEASFEETHTNGVVRWWNDELKDRSPEWAAPVCGIPAEQIRRVAIGFAQAAPRAISWVSPGVAMQVRGGYTAMAAHALNGLVGAADARGGVVQKTKVVADDIPTSGPTRTSLRRRTPRGRRSTSGAPWSSLRSRAARAVAASSPTGPPTGSSTRIPTRSRWRSATGSTSPSRPPAPTAGSAPSPSCRSSRTSRPTPRRPATSPTSCCPPRTRCSRSGASSRASRTSTATPA